MMRSPDNAEGLYQSLLRKADKVMQQCKKAALLNTWHAALRGYRQHRQDAAKHDNAAPPVVVISPTDTPSLSPFQAITYTRTEYEDGTEITRQFTSLAQELAYTLARAVACDNLADNTLDSTGTYQGYMQIAEQCKGIGLLSDDDIAGILESKVQDLYCVH